MHGHLLPEGPGVPHVIVVLFVDFNPRLHTLTSEQQAICKTTNINDWRRCGWGVAYYNHKLYMHVPESGRRGTPGRSCRLSAYQC